MIATRLLRRVGFPVLALAIPSLAMAAGRGIPGDYIAVGKNPNGAPYSGTLRIEQKGEVYQFTWDAGGTAKGTGVLRDGKLVVGYGSRGCGIAAFHRRADGALDGVWALPDSTQTGAELATPTTAGQLAGDYVIAGKNTDGAPYKGTLSVHEMKDGDFTLGWHVGGDSTGHGFREGDLLVAALGGGSCSVGVYLPQSDGTLKGNWRPPEGGRGTENLRRDE